MSNPSISEFGYVILFIISSIVILFAILFGVRFIRTDKPNDEKLTSYESGEEPVGNAIIQFNNRYYVIALIFLLFEVEVLFIFPWATVFGLERLNIISNGNWYWFATSEMLIFIFILTLGLAYVWVKGHLDWIIYEKTKTDSSDKELELYQSINDKYKSKNKS